MASTSGGHVCRRLFCDPVQRSTVHHTLEQIMRIDGERFSTVWKFDPLTANPIKNQKNETCWQICEPKTNFYSEPPRRLKARRRLTSTVARHMTSQLTRSACILGNSNSLNVMDPSFTFNFTCSLNLDASPGDRNTVEPSHSVVVPSTQTSKAVLPYNCRPSILGTASLGQTQQTLARTIFRPLSIVSLSCAQPLRQHKSLSRLYKRKVNSKLTDYFVINKKARTARK